MNGDEMAIGVFGPRQRLGEDGAREIVDGIVLAMGETVATPRRNVNAYE
jgi:hypothetical protein